MAAVAPQTQAQQESEGAWSHARGLGYSVVLKGPANAPLPGAATLRVPEGFEFWDTELVERYAVPVGKARSGESVVTARAEPALDLFIRYVPLGWIDDSVRLNASQVMRERQRREASLAETDPELASSRSTGWARPLTYNPQRRRLDVTTFQRIPPQTEVNGWGHVSFVLTRRGVYQIEVASAEPIERAWPRIETILDGFDIPEGDRLEDVKPSDPRAALTLQQLAVLGLPTH